MINFLKETVEILRLHNKTWDDVRFIRNDVTQVLDKEAFIKSMDFEYDKNGEYDKNDECPNIDEGLVIVGDDWWLERYEYYGSEGWEFKTLPTPLEESENCIMKEYPFEGYFLEGEKSNTHN